MAIVRGALRPTRLTILAVAGAIVLAACAGDADLRNPAASLSGSPVEGPSTEPDEEAEDPEPLVDPEEIVSGGPPPDGIPPIDDPMFLPPDDVGSLDAREPVIVLEIAGDARAYPARIMIWHEIVNDVVGGVPVAVTYCPLCNTGLVFERPTIDGELLDFGTSGKLYRSNLVMYDRQTGSLWPQALGQAVVGPLTGTELVQLAAQMVSWGDWRDAHPDGLVLTPPAGVDRPYGENPYEGYDEPGTPPSLFVGELDDRLDTKARVVGVRIGSRVVAYPYAELERLASGGWSVIADLVGGKELVVFWKAGTLSAVDAGVIADSRDVGATGVFSAEVEGRELTFRATPGGIVDEQTGSAWDIFGRAVAGPMQGTQLERVVSIESFWFDWAAFFPVSDIFGVDAVGE